MLELVRKIGVISSGSFAEFIQQRFEHAGLTDNSPQGFEIKNVSVDAIEPGAFDLLIVEASSATSFDVDSSRNPPCLWFAEDVDESHSSDGVFVVTNNLANRNAVVALAKLALKSCVVPRTPSNLNENPIGEMVEGKPHDWTDSQKRWLV